MYKINIALFAFLFLKEEAIFFFNLNHFPHAFQTIGTANWTSSGYSKYINLK